jgi:hypothetical protein
MTAFPRPQLLCASLKRDLIRAALQEAPARVSNAAALQLQVTKANNPFLSTLPAPGEAQFLTVLKPCSILLPHVHQRATEFYSILFGARSLLAVPAVCVLLTLAGQALCTRRSLVTKTRTPTKLTCGEGQCW